MPEIFQSRLYETIRKMGVVRSKTFEHRNSVGEGNEQQGHGAGFPFTDVSELLLLLQPLSQFPPEEYER